MDIIKYLSQCNMNDEELLNKLYYKDLILSGSTELYKKAKQAHPKITMKFVKEWLSNQQSAQMNDKPVQKKEFKPIYSEAPYAFQMDLTFFPRYKKKNDDYYVLFTAININTRFGYAYAMKDKEMSSIIKVIKEMEKKTVINVLQCDLGTEFNNYEFKQFCSDNNIILDLFKSDGHRLGIINRFHRTIKDKLVKYFDSFDTVKWVDIIDKIIYNYNHSVNRGIGYKPAEVNDFIENEIRQKKKEEGQNIRDVEPEFKVGQYIRTLNEKNQFEDKMKSKYSDEVYEITKVKNNSIIIKDGKGILYKIKNDEVKVVNKPTNNIILTEKTKTNNKHKQDKILNKEDQKPENIIREKRVRKDVDYKQLNSGKK